MPTIAITASSIIAVLAFLYVIRKGNTGVNQNKGKGVRVKDRAAVIRIADRRLGKNPKDAGALLSLAELHYVEGDYESSFKYYTKLIELCATVPDLDEFEITLRHAICALKMKNFKEAYQSFMIAKSFKREHFELDHNLGYLEMLRKNYQRAEVLLQSAKKLNPESLQTYKYLGISSYRLGKYGEAVHALQRWLEGNQDDKESRLFLATCYFYLNQFELAEKMFSHLRADPVYGPQAALFSGTIHMKSSAYERAVFDFDVGLRHKDMPPKVAVELKYRAGVAYLKLQDLANATRFFREIWEVDPNYRDVEGLLKNSQELNANQSLKIFLMGTVSEFTTLCRTMVQNYFNGAKVKITDISNLEDENIDILAEVVTTRWEDLVIFCFIRAKGTIGDFLIRDFHSRMKERKISRGICLTSAEFNESAKRYVEARTIDLVENDGLLKLLKKAW